MNPAQCCLPIQALGATNDLRLPVPPLRIVRGTDAPPRRSGPAEAPAAAAAPAATGPGRLATWVQALSQRVAAWRAARRQRVTLAGFATQDMRLLRDIGLGELAHDSQASSLRSRYPVDPPVF